MSENDEAVIPGKMELMTVALFFWFDKKLALALGKPFEAEFELPLKRKTGISGGFAIVDLPQSALEEIRETLQKYFQLRGLTVSLPRVKGWSFGNGYETWNLVVPVS